MLISLTCWLNIYAMDNWIRENDWAVTTRSYSLTFQALQTNQVSRASLYLIHPVASLTARNIAMMFEHIYGVASFLVILIVLLCVFKMYLALTATCREHRAFLVESATREEQQRVNRAQRLEIEGDRRRNTKTVRASASPSATWWTTFSRSKYNI